jgi:hypothetical protein
MKKLIKRIFGITKLEEEKARAEAQAEESKKQALIAAKAEELSKMAPKERATLKKEAWVSVMDTKINQDNPRNGFFELDWNEYFITELRKNGYGFEGDPEEEIVDRWFRDIVRNMLSDEGLDTNRGSGFVNMTRLADGRAEIE